MKVTFRPCRRLRAAGPRGRWPRLALLLGLALAGRVHAQAPADTPLVQQVQLGRLRNDYAGFVGLHFRTGPDALLVSSLGRYMVAGNTGTHRLKLVDAGTGQDVAGSLVSLSLSGRTPGQFQYVPLPAPLTLGANTAYYLVSEESLGGDQWYDDDTQVGLSPPATTGTGLAASYFNTQDLSGTPVLTRTDATVDFSWGSGSPDGGVNVDHFSARWTGQVLAPASGAYTFTTTSDDGVRLWVNGQQIVNNWTDHAPADDAGTITLAAGQKYDVRLEYYENSGGAEAHLRWAYPGQASQVVPQSQLFPSAPASRQAAGPDATAAPLTVYPNPSPDGRATAVLTARAAQPATVQVRDARGRVVEAWTAPVPAGHTEWRLPRALPRGTYFVRTTLDGQAQRFTLKVE